VLQTAQAPLPLVQRHPRHAPRTTLPSMSQPASRDQSAPAGSAAPDGVVDTVDAAGGSHDAAARKMAHSKHLELLTELTRLYRKRRQCGV
jgi:hypothetical protein